MNWLLAIPLELRLAILAILGAFCGAAVNVAVYRLAWQRRLFSPWGPTPPGVRRGWADRIPLWGWWRLRREASQWGRGFWIRPLLVEGALAAGFPLLYWWEVVQQGLLWGGGPAMRLAIPAIQALHVQLASHLILVSLMLACSLIDADEKTIPDGLTIPGTLAGLAIAAAFPVALLPILRPHAGGIALDFLQLASPNPWPVALNAGPGLGVGLCCWWLWIVGLMRRTWYSRHGWGRAAALSLARLRRARSTLPLLLLGLAGSGGIALLWHAGGARWGALLSALSGMAAGGLMVWMVRIVASAVLNREAMGFGDVTLMAMLGTFFGWQGSLIVFVLAPIAGLVIGMMVVLFRSESEIPYGPFLCTAALVTLVRWPAFWQWAFPFFALGLWVPVILAVCLLLMAVLLAAWRMVRSLLVGL